jgi:FemAB-related protein (PEP-CTERM system-associated)
MKEYSSESNIIKNLIKNVENEIYSIFKEQESRINNLDNVYTVSSGLKYSEDQINTDDISIELVNTHDDQWNLYIDNNPRASFYHKIEWKKVIEHTFAHECYYFIAKNKDGSTVGILPSTRLNSTFFGDFLVSMPYFNYGGPIADSYFIEEKLMEAANTKAKELNVNHVEYRDDIKRDGYPVKTEKVNMLLELKSTTDELWNSFTPKLRAQIKRPQKENTETVIGNIEYLDDFYKVFARNMRDLGTPVYSKYFFKKILETFTENTHIIVVKMNNKPVSAAFLIGYKDNLEIPWASTIKDVNHLSINMLLYWEVLKFAVTKKYKYFDFGRSSKDSGTYRFKKQWGAQPKQLYWHYWLKNNNALPALNPSNPKYLLFIELWKRLPVFISKIIGPHIVKNLP